LKKRVRGIRPLERAVEGREDEEAEIVQGYCAAVRGALSDDGRAPLEPSGLKLEERLSAIAASLDRVTEQKGGSKRKPLAAMRGRLAQGAGGDRRALARGASGICLGAMQAAEILENRANETGEAVRKHYEALLERMRAQAAAAGSLQGAIEHLSRGDRQLLAGAVPLL
jgi:hypothetical protein